MHNNRLYVPKNTIVQAGKSTHWQQYIVGSSSKTVKFSFMHSHFGNRPNCYSNDHANANCTILPMEAFITGRITNLYKPTTKKPCYCLLPLYRISGNAGNTTRDVIVQQPSWTNWLF